jgi:hypothetical protein
MIIFSPIYVCILNKKHAKSNTLYCGDFKAMTHLPLFMSHHQKAWWLPDVLTSLGGPGNQEQRRSSDKGSQDASQNHRDQDEVEEGNLRRN